MTACAPSMLPAADRDVMPRAPEPYEELVPFGYFTPRLLQAAHDEAMREVIMPGLEHLGLARAA